MLVANGKVNVYVRNDETFKAIENIKGLNICHINSVIAADSAVLLGNMPLSVTDDPTNFDYYFS